MRAPLKLDSTTTELRDFRDFSIVYFFSLDRLKLSCSVVHNDNEPQCGLLEPFVLKTKAIEATNKPFSHNLYRRYYRTINGRIKLHNELIMHRKLHRFSWWSWHMSLIMHNVSVKLYFEITIDKKYKLSVYIYKIVVSNKLLH